MQSHCPSSLIGPLGANRAADFGPQRRLGEILGGWSQLRVRKAVPQQKELLREISSEGVRVGFG